MEIPRIIQLKKILDQRGNLTALEQYDEVPFKIRRVYWIFDVPGGERRGGHAYHSNHEIIIALSGSFDVSVDTGTDCDTFTLNRSYSALYVPAGTWRELSNFSTNSLALILASNDYDECDYIREYSTFETRTGCKYTGQAAASAGTDVSSDRYPYIATEDQSRGYTVDDVKFIRLDQHHSERKGDLCVVQAGATIPFDIRRVFYIYDIPAGADRGQHAHRCGHELIVAASGSFTVKVDDGERTRTYLLNRPFNMLYLPPGVWVELFDFSSGAIALAVCPNEYDRSDHICDYAEFKTFKQI